MFFSECRNCAIGFVAAGTVCTLCAELAAAMVKPESQVSLYISVDQPHDHREPRAPTPMGALQLVTGSTTSADSSSLSWLSGEIPSSIAASTAWDFSPIGEKSIRAPLRWQAPPYPAPGRDYLERPALTFKST
jgi:hypothetical protein